jgi:hypothetical protein
MSPKDALENKKAECFMGHTPYEASAVETAKLYVVALTRKETLCFRSLMLYPIELRARKALQK